MSMIKKPAAARHQWTSPACPMSRPERTRSRAMCSARTIQKVVRV